MGAEMGTAGVFLKSIFMFAGLGAAICLFLWLRLKALVADAQKRERGEDL